MKIAHRRRRGDQQVALSPWKRLVCLAFVVSLLGSALPAFPSVQSGENQVTPGTAPAETAPQNDELNQARQLAAAGRIEAAAAAYRRVLKSDPTSFDAHYELTQLLISQQKLDEARTQLAEAIKSKPGTSQARKKLAQAALQLDDMVMAEEAFVAAKELDQQDPSVRYNLGRVYEKRGKPELALEEYLAFLKVAPSDARANNIRARVAQFYENAQQLDAAIAMYRELIANDPSRPSAHYALAGIYYRRAQYEEALPEYQEVARLDPANSAAE